MKRTLVCFVLMCIAMLGLAQTPDIRINTSIYETQGATNSFTLVLGAAEGKTGYADIRCSGGNMTEAEIVTAEYDSETGSLVGTNVTCQVDAQGCVEVFCDEGVVIDYIFCDGAEITGIDVKNPENIEILSLEHNKLQSMDLSEYTGLSALYLGDNPFDVKPLIVGPNKPNLQILNLPMIDNIDIGFDISSYTNLQSFTAYNTPSLVHLNPSGCPNLLQLSIDNTSVSGLDLRNNGKLRVLNISETRIEQIDLTPCKNLQQFYATHRSAFNSDIKLKSLDVTCCPNLIYLAVSGNNLTSVDLSKCTALRDIYLNWNRLTSLDLSNNKELVNVFIDNNYMDFNTLPVPEPTWGEYSLNQRPFVVPSSYLQGSSLSLESYLVRPGSETYATVFRTNELDPLDVQEIDPSLYKFENGLLVVNEVISDSIYASFYNTAFPDTELKTTRFLVKDDSSFDNPNLMAVLGTNLKEGDEVKLYVGLANAKVGNKRTFFCDFGDGKLQEFASLSSTIQSYSNVEGEKVGTGAIKIYLPEGEVFTSLKVEDIKLTNVDLSFATQLRELTFTNTRLTALDLKWNRALESVNITGNNFGSGFTLEGANGGYGKNVLSHINLSNNNMTAVKLNEPGSWKYIDLSHNKLTEVNFTDADYVDYLDVSYNSFEYLKVNYLGRMKTFYCNNNKLTEIVMPETNVVETFDCSNNCFTFATLPDFSLFTCPSPVLTYAPQADIQIPSVGPGYNLSGQNVSIKGKSTVFTWKTVEGEALTEGVDYTCTDGVTHFANTTVGKKLYCELTNAAFPAFAGRNALKTTAMLSAGMPTHLLGSFTTTKGGQTVRVSLASAVPNNSVYIDWTGTESLEQYPLATSYTVFEATTTQNAKVKVWSYEENDNLTVFSLTNAALADVDLSPMKNLKSLTLSGSGISDLVWPQSPNIKELSLDNCRFSKIDLTRYPNLTFVNLDNNQFDSVDLSGLTKLGSAGFSNNGLLEITLGDNTSLWQLALSNNLLEKIDLKGAPNLEQLFLNNNILSSVDLTPLKQLRVLYLDQNKFDFSNLPIPQPTWNLYTYGKQPNLIVECVDGKVDLSSQALRDTAVTTFVWYYDEPVYDAEEGTISGEQLIEGEEYIIKDGVTTFLTDIDKACCVLLNSLFPRTYLQTNVIPVRGVDAIETATYNNKLKTKVIGNNIIVEDATEGAEITVFATDGSLLGKAKSVGGVATVTVQTPGVYVVSGLGNVSKVAVR
ncbi:MAG: hypothetical protein HUK06_09470 [Bacteroidaceae bacterium]|nr:hypothetical protein [Bacteroidaceae bacterium]